LVKTLAQHDFADKLVSEFEAREAELLHDKAQLVEHEAQLIEEVDSLTSGSLFKIDIKATNLIL
jgi:hypothetical protein